MDTNKMRDISREQFEEVFQAKFPCIYAAAKAGESKAHGDMSVAWWGWQASREAVVVDLGAPSHWVADYAACGGGMTVFDAEKAAKVTDPMCSKTPSYTIHALEKAGLKVAP